ncbi:MAG: ATP-binding protein [Pseudomonadota bacterium]
MKHDFRLKIALVFSSLVVLVLSGLYLQVDHRAQSLAGDIARERLRREVVVAAQLAGERLRENPPADPQRLALSLATQLKGRVTILALDGRVLGDSAVGAGKRLGFFEVHAGRPELGAAARNGFGEGQRFSSVLRQEVFYAAARMDMGHRGTGLVRLGITRSAVAESVAPLTANLLRSVLISAATLIILSLSFTHLITRPLRGLVALAAGIEQRDLNQAARPRSEDEFSRVGRALENVAGRLERELLRLREEKERLETILRGMAEAVMVTDDRARIVLVNDAFRRTFQLGEDFVGKDAFGLVRVAEFQEKLERILREGGGSATFEFMMQHPARLHLAGSVVSLPGGGATSGAVIVFHDITELKRLEQVRKDFVANISHELRTPLSSIRGYAETLEGDLSDRQRTARFAGIIRRHAERLANLLTDILNLSRIESGEAVLKRREFDMVQAVGEVLDQLRGKAEEKTIRVAAHVTAEKTLPVMGSREFIDQVLVNLIDNAIKYSPPGASVEVRVSSTDDGTVRVDVTDTGIGIPPEDLDRVFERFYRVAKDRSRKVEGTGLGLAIAKNIIAAHKGRIWVESRPGKGSTFSFTVPTV